MVPRGGRTDFFFLFNHYLHVTYLDHGEIIYSPPPVGCPNGGSTLQAPLSSGCPGLSQDMERTKDITDKRNHLSIYCGRHEVKRGQEQW